ncbi:MAG: FAD-dependent oxidoreductase, partial [Planctomycetota bacterium]
AAEVQRLVSTCPSIDVIAGAVEDLLVEGGAVRGVLLAAGAGVVEPCPDAVDANTAMSERAVPIYPARPDRPATTPRRLVADSVVLTSGTFLRGLMHTGDRRTPGGRVGEKAAGPLSTALQRLGFELGRLKTGTPPRLDRATIRWDDLDVQVGDERPVPFSDLSPDRLEGGRFPRVAQTGCRITATTADVHELIRANLHRAPMYDGQIEASSGPRYCPSIEDKVVRFADRDSHHVFLEPESLHTNEVYCNGISTSLPTDVQEHLVHGMPGCENATILRWGYAVEYDMVWPHQIDVTTMTKSIRGLFLAGQINCTTGYEEAAGQGVVAGVNAAHWSVGEEPFTLGREQAYIGVMLDDLVSKTPREPYRMFTSRAEHRLALRADNADVRLTALGRELGLVCDDRFRGYEHRAALLKAVQAGFERVMIEGRPLNAYVRRPTTTIEDVQQRLAGAVDADVAANRTIVERSMTETRYAGYIVRQNAELRRRSDADRQRLPEWLDYRAIPGLRSEAIEVMDRFRPATMGQASRLAGVNPADLTLVAVAIRRGRETTGSS